MLEGKGLGNIPRTERHDPAYEVSELLNDYTEDQLRGIILAVKKGFSDKRLKSMSKTGLIEYINGKLFKSQAKSATAIYIGIQQEKRKAERIKESNKGPGNKEISK